MVSATGFDEIQHQPVVRLVNDLIHRAVASRASDIHLEPMMQNMRVRLRIDGVLHEYDSISAAILEQVISRLKVLAHINIAEKRVPQDGKFSLNLEGNLIDLRVSTFPCVHGEKMVIRILDRSTHMISLNQLGMHEKTLELFRTLIRKLSGLLLVVGPTGSGKTTTLYAVLSALNDPKKNIVTLEDPVEYSLPGVIQGQISSESGLSFDHGIRSVLRQDPDIIMVGEIRDRKTARTAIEAALTGHLVLSTLHTNDAAGAFVRLVDMGIEPFLLNSSLIGVLAQRLVRLICRACCVSHELTDDEQMLARSLGVDGTVLHKGRGCNACKHIGYKGRTGLFELLCMTQPLRELAMQCPTREVLQDHAIKEGMTVLAHDGANKVISGLISIDELAGVVA